MNILLLSLIFYFNFLVTLRYYKKLKKNKHAEAILYFLYLFEVIIIDTIVYNVYKVCYALKG